MRIENTSFNTHASTLHSILIHTLVGKEFTVEGDFAPTESKTATKKSFCCDIFIRRFSATKKWQLFSIQMLPCWCPQLARSIGTQEFALSRAKQTSIWLWSKCFKNMTLWPCSPRPVFKSSRIELARTWQLFPWISLVIPTHSRAMDSFVAQYSPCMYGFFYESRAYSMYEKFANHISIQVHARHRRQLCGIWTCRMIFATVFHRILLDLCWKIHMIQFRKHAYMHTYGCLLAGIPSFLILQLWPDILEAWQGIYLLLASKVRAFGLVSLCISCFAPMQMIWWLRKRIGPPTGSSCAHQGIR